MSIAILILTMMNQLVCRCCLAENPDHTYSIFNDANLRAELIECLPPGVNVEPDDGLPESICDHCCSRVRDFVEFRHKCANADCELRQRYDDMNRAIEQALGMNAPTSNSQWQPEINNATDLSSISGQENGTDLPVDETELSKAFEDIEMSVLNELLLDDNTAGSTPDSGYNSGGSPEDHTLLDVFLNDIISKTPPESQTTIQNDLILNDSDSSVPNEGSEKVFTILESVQILPVSNIDQILPPVPVPIEKPPPIDSISNTVSPPIITVPIEVPSPTAKQTTQSSTTKGQHACAHCNKKFTRNFQLKLHMTSVHKLGDGLQYPCDICQKTFASRHSLSYHQKSTHSTERPFACTLCQKRFVLRSQLASHSRIHTGETKPRVFECSECGKLWPTRSDLRTHMRSHNPNEVRPFKCERCDKCFFTRGHLSAHELVHTGQKPFVCNYCGKSYQNVGNLNNHLVRRHAEALLSKKYQQQQQYQLQQMQDQNQLPPPPPPSASQQQQSLLHEIVSVM